MIIASDLVALFKQAFDEHWGYIYGKTHEMWSAEKQAEYVKDYKDDPDRANSCKYGGKWAGHWVTDCSGLFRWAYSCLGGSIAHGSNSIWVNYWTARGTLKEGKKSDSTALRPGTAVFTSSGVKHNHIGLYIGNGEVIEAQGAENGVIKSKITNKKWTHWAELKYIQYEDERTEPSMTATVVLPVGAKGNTVNMRDGAGVNYGIIARIPVGATVEVIADKGQWCEIGFSGKVGYMMSNYLEYTGQGGESGGDVVTEEERLDIEMALSKIEEQIEVIRSTLGRG